MRRNIPLGCNRGSFVVDTGSGVPIIPMPYSDMSPDGCVPTYIKQNAKGTDGCCMFRRDHGTNIGSRAHSYCPL